MNLEPGDRQYELAAMPEGFGEGALLRSEGGVHVYRAHDEHVARSVTLRLATPAVAPVLLEDARRLAAIDHPGVIAVLAAGNDQARAYVATPDLDAHPLSESVGLTDAEASRVAADVAGAIDALAQAGLRAPVSCETVLVVATPTGVRGVLDPLRASAHGSSAISASAPAESMAELAGVIEAAVSEPGDALRRSLAEARSGVLSPGELASILEPPALPVVGARRSHRLAWVALGLAVPAAVIVIALVRSQDDGSPAAPVAASSPAGRVVATVPLGLGKDELPVGMAVIGKTAWIGTTAGRLRRIDTVRNLVVGAPIRLPGKHSLSGLVSDGLSLITTDYEGWVLRIDPSTAKIVRRRHLATEPHALTLAGTTLWIAVAKGLEGGSLRLDSRTLASLGPRLGGPIYPRKIIARGSRAWIIGGDSWGRIDRVDAGDGSHVIAWVGPQPVQAVLNGATLWVTDAFNGTVAPLDPERMRFLREPLRPARMAMSQISIGRDIWVKTTRTLGDTGTEFLERFDGTTGARRGLPVAVGKNGQAMTFARGSIWVATATQLLRLVPRAGLPAESTRISPPTSPRALAPGPLGAARWRTTKFDAPFTFTTKALEWVAVWPLPDSVQIFGARQLEISLGAATPRQIFSSDATPVAITGPAQALRVLRGNPRLRVVDRGTTVVGGHPALRVAISAHEPTPHPEVCGSTPCVLLYPIQNGTQAINSRGWHELLLLQNRGRTVILTLDGESARRAAGLAAAEGILRTIRFD